MRHFRNFMLIGCALATVCSTGKVNVDTADQTPPQLSLSVTALRSQHANGQISHCDGRQPIVQSRRHGKFGNHHCRVRKGQRWYQSHPNLECRCEPSRHERWRVLATPNSAFQSVTRQAVMKAAPGLKLGVFAEADNFGTGGPAQTTALSGVVALNVTGVTEPQFTGSTGTTTITFQWNNGAQAYVSAGAPSPEPGAKVVGVLADNPFGGGVHVSLYRGSANINNLDLRTGLRPDLAGPAPEPTQRLLVEPTLVRAEGQHSSEGFCRYV